MKFILSLFFSLILTSCITTQKRGIELAKQDYSQLSGWNEENITPGMQAFKNSCVVLKSSRMQAQKLFSTNNSIWQQKCLLAQNAVAGRQFFETNFTPYLVTNNGIRSGKFTGYFEKEIEASFRKDNIYKYPIYRTPDNPMLLNLTRREIENGSLRGKNLEIAYAKSQAKLFFLHIQGSGSLKLPDGKIVKIGFAAKNNQQYTGIGAYMLEHGLIKHGSADEIIDWLEKHPISGRTIMNMNDRYVFFSIKNSGPQGSLGIILTPQASLAVDTSFIPLGVPLWLQTSLPVNKRPFTKLMNAQDTGSAIKGAIRGDIFFGEGDIASNTASGMNAAGNYYMLLPKEINPKTSF